MKLGARRAMGMDDQVEGRRRARTLCGIRESADGLAHRTCFMNRTGDQLPL
jgi:hypothetical protein